MVVERIHVPAWIDEELISSHHLQCRFRITGYRDPEPLARSVLTAVAPDLFLFVSRYREVHGDIDSFGPSISSENERCTLQTALRNWGCSSTYIGSLS